MQGKEAVNGTVFEYFFKDFFKVVNITKSNY